MSRPVLVTGVDTERVRKLLEAARLPTVILTSDHGSLWMMEEGGATAVGGFEFYGEDALLRSVAVDEPHRGGGLGGRLTDELLAIAAGRGVRRVWLLTETAEGFFAKKGFRRVERSAITNEALLNSPEFTFVCSKTAVCMMKAIS